MQRKYYSLEQCREQIGKEVRVTGNDVKRYMKYNLIGCCGTIKDYRYDGTNVDAFAVEIEDEYNLGSKAGLFWIAPYNLEEIKNTEDKVMDIKTFCKDAKFAILRSTAKPNDFGTVGVYYGELKPGDIVVCDYGYGNGALSVRVVEISDRERESLTVVDCEIMGVCDRTEYLDRKTKRERRAELKEQMIEQAKRFHEEEYWRLLSEQDPAMKALYDEFETLED